MYDTSVPIPVDGHTLKIQYKLKELTCGESELNPSAQHKELN